MRNPNAPWEVRNDAARKRWLMRGRQSRFGISRRAYEQWMEIYGHEDRVPLTRERILAAFKSLRDANRA